MNSKIMMKSLDDTRSGRTLFVMCFMLYSVALCGRLNYASVLAKVISTGFLEKDVAGLIATAFNVTYGCCRFVSGFIANTLLCFLYAFLSEQIVVCLRCSAATDCICIIALFWQKGNRFSTF